MSLSSVELWQRISSAGLAAPMICRSWAAEALQGLQPSDAANATKILEQLVLLGRLTDYQADLIAGRAQGEFKRGGWTLLRPVAVPLWDGWFEAVKSPADPPTWLRWLSSEALAEYHSAAPSLPRGLRLAQLKSPSLQTVFVPELIDKQLQLRVQPLRGVPLPVALKAEPDLGLQAAQIVRQVAEALRPLHAAEMAHGRVLPDRVYWDAAARDAVLAQDPICCHTGSLDTQAMGVVQTALNGLSPAQFMAPEFLAPGQAPTPSTDIYSLGCLWWWLVTGKPLVVGSTLDKQLARQAEASIALPKDCPLPPPIVRCLQHCLAKNLPARFASAEQLCLALDAASAAVARGPVAKQRTVKPQTVAATIPRAASPQAIAAIPPATLPAVGASQQPAAPKQPAAPNPASANTPVLVVAPSADGQPPASPSPAAQGPAASAVARLAAKPAAGPPVDKSLAVKPAAVEAKEQPQLQGPVKPTSATADAVKADVVQPEATRAKPAAVSPAAKAQATTPAKTLPPTAEATPFAASETPDNREKAPWEQPSAPSTAEQAAPELVIPKSMRKPGAKPVSRKKSKRKPANRWVLPVIGGLGSLCLLLGILIFSGVLKPAGRRPVPRPVEIADETPVVEPTPAAPEPTDPRLDVYRIVATGTDLLWAPPSVPKPISLDMLPPGGQMFVTLRPQLLLNSATGKSLLSAFDDSVSPLLGQVSQRAGMAFDAIERVTIAFYAENEVLLTCLRIQLVKPQPLAELKAGWGSPAEEKIGSLALLTNAAGESYFLAEQPLADVQSVTEFAVGPTALMRETVEMQGAAGPLLSQLGKLWQASDTDADLSVLLATPFLFSDGKALLASAPTRLASRIRDLLEVDTRAALIQTRFEPTWYLETQLMGPSEREAPRLNELLRQRISGASTAVEDWFVAEQPHPYWRSLAIRFPQMLRVLADQTRYGIESGAAVANTYLPPEAAANILLSSWIAAQAGATLASDAPIENAPAAATAKPLTMEEYLARPIKLSFDQEPIETALRLVSDEANANLPAGTPQLRFALDGGAFERAGITRNQQLRDFKHVDLPMRDALTSIAKRGNPVTTVKDTREQDQRLIWVVRDDPEQPGKQMISLTTRAEATTNNIALTVEFAPAK